ncbi:LOW QUALITY PROTEIN: cilia- and flagella-associated protein 44-like [Centruroides vittatus]|uniref:LOW QUALITY PROTEIN: cilia- and flagella-associated protein 44-like n=1 Tax=Centruroides vittatus TaxID=120091 RepID=UPI00350F5731
MDEFYNYDAIRCKPQVYNAPSSQFLSESLLSKKYSFGWQHSMLSNFCLLKEETVVIGAGSSIIILKLKTGSQRIFETVCGKGVAHISAYPDYTMFAVAEKGINPTIDIFTYPDVNLKKLLQNGAEESYVHLDFDNSGKYLVSLSSFPNYSLIIWNWIEERIILKTKASDNDVWQVKFSPFTSGNIITSGVSHITFWKMENSFTGLKLKSQLGKFGKINVSNIRSFVQLPNDIILSTSDWGNILLWEDGILKAQICQKGKRRCHDGNINQIILKGGEFLTIGDDGWIKIWDTEGLEVINIDQEKGLLEIKPTFELLVKQNADLLYTVQSPDKKDEKVWFCLDLKGYIWKLDLSFTFSPKQPEVFRRFPTTEITGCEISPTSHIIAIASTDGILRLYNCLNYSPITSHEFHQAPTSMMWGSRMLDRGGGSLILGFEDGVVRWMVIKKNVRQIIKFDLEMRRVVKTHTAAITCIKTNSFATYMATASLDGTIFYYFVRGGEMKPLGFVDLRRPIQWLIWLDKIELIIAYCKDDILTVVETIRSYGVRENKSTYNLDLSWKEIELKSVELHEKVSVTIPKEFESVKTDAEIDEEIEENLMHLDTKMEKNNTNEQEINRSENELTKPNGYKNTSNAESNITDEAEDMKTSELKSSYLKFEKDTDYELPRKPFNITCGSYTGIAGKFWLCMGGNNRGFLYEYSISKDILTKREIPNLTPNRILKMFPSELDSVSCLHFTTNKSYLVSGHNDGVLSVYCIEKRNKNEDMYLTSFWSSGIHDFQKGSIKFITSSHDGKLLATTGEDGNVFLFYTNAPKYDKILPENINIPASEYLGGAPNIEKDALSLEQICKVSLEAENLKKLEKNRFHQIQQMTLLRANYEKLTSRNKILPKHMQSDFSKIVVHDNIKAPLEKEIKIKSENIKKKLEYEVAQKEMVFNKLNTQWKSNIQQQLVVLSSFLTNEEVSTSRMAEFPLNEYENVDFTELEELKKLELKSQSKELLEEESKNFEKFALTQMRETAKSEDSRETISRGSFEHFRTNDALAKLLRKNLGDYKLKIDHDYLPPEYLPVRARQKYKQLLKLEVDVHRRKTAYNNQVMLLNSWREDITNKLEQYNGFIELKFPTEIYLERGKGLSPSIKNELLKIQSTMYEHKCCDDIKQASSTFFNTCCCPRQVENKLKIWKYSNNISMEKTSDISSKLKMADEIILNYTIMNSYIESLKSIWMFDSRVHFLRLQRSLMDQELKYSDIRRKLFYIEHQILDKYDQEEEELINKCKEEKKEKEELESDLDKQMEKMAEQAEIIAKLKEEETKIHSLLDNLLGENNKFHDLLTMFFKKNVSLKTEKKEEAEEEEEEDNEDFEDDKSDWLSEEDYYEDFGWDGSGCPPCCDPDLFESVCKLREKRTEVETKLKETEKLHEAEKLEWESLTKKLKLIDNVIYPVKKALEQVQLKKQKELNEINVTVNLFMDQIQHCAPQMPADLNTAILFPYQVLENLKERGTDLAKQNIERRKTQKEILSQQAVLTKQCETLSQKIREMNEMSKAKMISKFGQTVDMKRIEMLKESPEVQELERKQKKIIMKQEESLREWKRKIEDKKREYYHVLLENTEKVQILAALKRRALVLNSKFEDKKRCVVFPKNM